MTHGALRRHAVGKGAGFAQASLAIEWLQPPSFLLSAGVERIGDTPSKLALPALVLPRAVAAGVAGRAGAVVPFAAL
jgi:hypothetical protein